MQARRTVPYFVLINMVLVVFAACVQEPAEPGLRPSPNPIDSNVPEFIFSQSTTNETDPEDVLEEVAYFGGGGGLMVCFERPVNTPSIELFTEGAELHDLVPVHTCGWEDGEEVELTVTDPNGTPAPQLIEARDTIVDSDNGALFLFKTNALVDFPGVYTFTVTGNSGRTVGKQIQIDSPSDTRIYWNVDGTLLLYNFAPNERVRVFAYVAAERIDDTSEPVIQLLAWQEFNIGQSGHLILETQFDRKIKLFAAVGDISGEVVPRESSSPGAIGIDEVNILSELE